MNKALWLLPACLLIACSSSEEVVAEGPPAVVEVETGPVAMRRLTDSQYRNSVRDVLGQDIAIAGRLEPDVRRSGLLSVGSSYVTVTPTGFEQYEDMAYRVAAQAVDEAHRGANVPCSPVSETGADAVCADLFVRSVGRRLFRRSLTEEEVSDRVAVAVTAATTLNDFYGGLEFALASLLTSPHFLFRVPTLLPVDSGTPRLSDLSLATRLSYALWNSTPDEALLAAAEQGRLSDPAGLAAEIERMLTSERLTDGIRSFFFDRLVFDEMGEGFRKDSALFPAYDQALIEDAAEQTLMTVTEHLVAGRDYRALFTSRHTFLTRSLAALYGVPVAVKEGFAPYEFSEDSPRAGLLTHASLLALHSHPGRSSPTLRGEFVRAVFLCQPVPAPPGDVDFSLVEQPDPDLPTIRDKVEAHLTTPGCASCHQLTDPIGLGLEQFDALGVYRSTENGAMIDPSGSLDGADFADAVGLGQALAAHPRLNSCLVRQLYMMVVGRDPVPEEKEELERLEAVFAAADYHLPVLWSAILGSPSVRWGAGTREVSP